MAVQIDTLTAGIAVVACGSYGLHGLIEGHTLHIDEVIDRISRDVPVWLYPNGGRGQTRYRVDRCGGK